MATGASKLADHFSLSRLANILRAYRRAAGGFDAKGHWQTTYGVYTLARLAARVGKMRLTRKADVGGAAIALDYEKTAPGGFRQKVVARMTCRADALATPTAWTFESNVVDGKGKPLKNTSLKKSARVRGEWIEITDGGGKSSRRIALPGAYTINWAIFDVVQRLGREAFAPLRFTMIDHFDQVKPGQTLARRKTATVAVGGKPLRLHACEQSGRGIVPWVYWVDDRRRLLFAVAGLEAYVLEDGDA